MKTKEQVISSLKKALEELDIISSLRLPVIQTIEYLQEESKECMYSKDDYTDEDRKVLCDSCEEECRFNQKKGSVSKDWSAEFDKILEPYKNSHNYKKLCLILRWWKSDYERWWHWKLNQKEESGLNWKDMSLQEKKDLVAELSKDIQKEEPVSEDLEKAIEQSFIYHENRGDDFRCDEQIETSYRYGFETGANWQKSKDAKLIINAKDDGYRLGLATMKEQLLAKAVDGVVKIDAGGYPYVDRTIELYDYDKDVPLAKAGEKVKVIVIKEE